MEAEHASLSCIIIDAHGDPIAQVAYRCALCRKICDSTTDAMLHYQIEHVDLFAHQLQQQQAQHQQQLLSQSQHQRQATIILRGGTTNMNSSSPATHLNQRHGSARQQFVSNPTVGSGGSNSASLLKRTSSSNQVSGSLLKRSATSGNTGGNSGTGSGQPTSSSLLRRASNVMRAYQTTNTNSNTRTTSRRSTTASSNASPASGSTGRNSDPNQMGDIIDTIHRPYATTSASRAAKRFAATSSTSSLERPINQSLDNISRASSRNASPRHVQRTNQYTANLKAKISAQRSAAATRDQQHQEQAQQNNSASATVSATKSTTAAASSTSRQLTESDANLSSSVLPTNIKDEPASNSTTISGSQEATINSQSPGGKDSAKSYSLRPRSSGKKSFRIS